jgi:alpha-tubulin suppressor-like RCC1 family protein
MTIGIKTLADCINVSISAANTPLEVLQLSSTIRDLDTINNFSVANTASLPAAADNKGRFIYIEDLCDYRFSDGTTWSNDLNSVATDFQIWGAGCNRWGTLGTSNLTCRSSPVSVVGGVTDWCQVSQGGSFNLALRANGTLWSWGLNSSRTFLGQNNTICCQNSPITVAGGFTDWRQISAGGAGGLGLRANGTLWGWGYNGWGRIGDGTTYDRSSPVSVVGGFTDWCRVSAGYRHALGVRTNGTLWVWGFNSYGQLGTNSVTATSSPVTPLGGFTDWCQVSAGRDHSLALRTNGTLWAWGGSSYGGTGLLGDNDTVRRSSPVSVVGGVTDWCTLAQGSVRNHNLAIRTNGTLWAWGGNGLGQLGDGTFDNRSSPVSVIGGFTDWCQVAAGPSQSSAVRTNGTLWMWGRNQYGQLGINSVDTFPPPASPVVPCGGLSGWCQTAMGSGAFAAIRAGKGF